MQPIEHKALRYSTELDSHFTLSPRPAKNRRGWLIVTVLFFSMFFTIGSQYGSAGVIFTALVRHFGWKRTAVSSLQAAVGLFVGLGGPPVGWLLDRVEAKFLVAGGILITGLGFLMAARANAFGPMMAAFIVMGLGMAGATYVPASYVITNWFKERRGLALALVISAVSLGSMVSSPVCALVIDRAGWRAAFIALAIPAFVLVPLVFAVVRGRPAEQEATDNDIGSAAVDEPGLEVAQALRGRSFWFINFAYVAYGFASSATIVHLVPYLVDRGVATGRAALSLSVVLGLGAICKPLFGILADRIGARRALALDFILLILGCIALTAAQHRVALWVFLGGMGLGWGTPVVLAPILLAESSGLKRFGTLAGLMSVFQILGSVTGPLGAGVIFDWTGSYIGFFELCPLILTIAIVLLFYGFVPFTRGTAAISES